MMFEDRRHAGVLLAEALGAHRGDAKTLVLALPRGGVAVGYEISVALQLPLDVFITRKIGLPECPEYAIGALTETGSVYVNPEAAEGFGLSPDEWNRLIDIQRREIARRQALYRQGRALPSVSGRTVMVVDDGIATGSTFFATIDALTKLTPRRLIAAIPVSPRSTAEQLRTRVDECVILATPEPFGAVGQFYTDFRQVEDAEVVEYLSRARQSYQERRSVSLSAQHEIEDARAARVTHVDGT